MMNEKLLTNMVKLCSTVQNWVVAVESDESLTSTYISSALSFGFVCFKRRYNTRKTPPNQLVF